MIYIISIIIKTFIQWALLTWDEFTDDISTWQYGMVMGLVIFLGIWGVWWHWGELASSDYMNYSCWVLRLILTLNMTFFSQNSSLILKSRNQWTLTTQLLRTRHCGKTFTEVLNVLKRRVLWLIQQQIIKLYSYEIQYASSWKIQISPCSMMSLK